jgi:hypothetical protein
MKIKKKHIYIMICIYEIEMKIIIYRNVCDNEYIEETYIHNDMYIYDDKYIQNECIGNKKE